MAYGLHNYWWQIIWILTAGLFLKLVCLKREEIVLCERHTRWSYWSAILLSLPYVLWAGFRTDYFGDTGVYRLDFSKIPEGIENLFTYISGVSKDKGFYLLSAIIKNIFGNSSVLYFLILAVIQMICLVLILRKYSCDYWFSMFLFVSTCGYMSWMHNGIRQFTAVTIGYVALSFILEKKYFIAIFLIFIAASIHSSAIILIPIIFIIKGRAWNKKTVISIFISIIILMYVNQFTNFLEVMLKETQYDGAVANWQEMEDDGVNPIRVIVDCVPMLLSIVGYKFVQYENDELIHFAVNASIVGAAIDIVAMGTSGIYMGRLPVYVSLFGTEILLPWEIEHMFTEESQKIVKIVAIILYLLLFYYQMHFAWGIL